MRIAGAALRLIVGAAMAWCVWLAVSAPEVPRASAVAALATFAVTAWQPALGLLVVLALTPAAGLLAHAPVRSAELLAWAFLCAWLLRAWRPLAPAGWPRVRLGPALLYSAAVVVSWAMLMTSSAAGVAPSALPLVLFRSIRPDHLIFSSPEPETWVALQTLAGVAVFLAAMAIARERPRIGALVARVLVVALASLAVWTVVAVALQSMKSGYAGAFLERYLSGERFSAHLADVNAAASLYCLAGLTGAALAAFDRRRRALWSTLVALFLPALWLAGSRTAVVAGLAFGVLAIPRTARQSQWWPTQRQVAVAATLIIVVFIGAVVVAERLPDRPGIGRSLRLRTEFSQTTLRMFGAGPIFGVGIGKYFDRSSEFMTPSLRAIYGNENAHNYFAQQFAELGVVGGVLFLCLVIPVVMRGWRVIRHAPEGDGTAIGLVAGSTAYLGTCLTGHPLLVPEAALPFWIVFGVIAATVSGTDAEWPRPRLLVAVAALAFAAGLGRAGLAYARTTMPPPERGFHQFEYDEGERFRWMTRHAVTYLPSGPGVVTFRLRAADRPSARPLVVDIAVGGHLLARRTPDTQLWTTVQLGVRGTTPGSFQRVDFWTNEFWTQEVRLGRRVAQRPISAMVTELKWTPIEPSAAQ